MPIANAAICIDPVRGGQAPHDPRSPIPGRVVSYSPSGGHGVGPPPAGLRFKHSIVVTSFPAQLSALKYWMWRVVGTIQGCLMLAPPSASLFAMRHYLRTGELHGRDSASGKHDNSVGTENRTVPQSSPFIFWNQCVEGGDAKWAKRLTRSHVFRPTQMWLYK